MKDEYTKESATLSEAIIKYGTLDPYDPQRVQVINVSLKEALTYVSVLSNFHTALCASIESYHKMLLHALLAS